MGYAYGIDLGTTNSCIARANEKYEVEIIKNLEGDELTPSVVEIKSPTEFVVGRAAKKKSGNKKVLLLRILNIIWAKKDFIIHLKV